jgi:hypothetical protein
MYLELILILEIRRTLTIITLIQLIKHCTRLNNTTFVNFRDLAGNKLRGTNS